MRKKTRLKWSPYWRCLPLFFPLWYPQGLNSRQPGTQKWTLLWTEFQEKTSRSGSGAERELLKLREDAEVPLPLFPFSLFSYVCNPEAAPQRLQFDWSQTLREGSLPVQWVELWSQDSGANLVACVFLSLSNLPPLGPVDNIVGRLKPQHSGQRTKEGSPGNQKLQENCREE